jgi:hypothetical protein
MRDDGEISRIQNIRILMLEIVEIISILVYKSHQEFLTLSLSGTSY